MIDFQKKHLWILWAALFCALFLIAFDWFELEINYKKDNICDPLILAALEDERNAKNGTNSTSIRTEVDHNSGIKNINNNNHVEDDDVISTFKHTSTQFLEDLYDPQTLANSITVVGGNFDTIDHDLHSDVPILFYTITMDRTRMNSPRIDFFKRLISTFREARNFKWVIVEDSEQTDPALRELLECSGLPSDSYHYFSHGPTRSWGNAQKNAAMQYIREAWGHGTNTTDAEIYWTPSTHEYPRIKNKGVVYSLDDDNKIDLRLFDELRRVRKFAVIPVGNLGMDGTEHALVEWKDLLPIEGKYQPPKALIVSGWNAGWGERRFPLDQAGYAFNVAALSLPDRNMFPDPWDHRDYAGETEFCQKIISDKSEAQPLLLEPILHETDPINYLTGERILKKHVTRIWTWHNEPIRRDIDKMYWDYTAGLTVVLDGVTWHPALDPNIILSPNPTPHILKPEHLFSPENAVEDQFAYGSWSDKECGPRKVCKTIEIKRPQKTVNLSFKIIKEMCGDVTLGSGKVKLSGESAIGVWARLLPFDFNYIGSLDMTSLLKINSKMEFTVEAGCYKKGKFWVQVEFSVPKNREVMNFGFYVECS